MKIAIIGSRGIPARWGGYETVAEELATRLASRGHAVAVYCRAGYSDQDRPRQYRGVKLIYLPSMRSMFFETPSHEFLSAFHSLFHDYDVYYILGCRTSWSYLIHWVLGKRIVFQTDGLDWERRKWGVWARRYLRLSYWLAVRVATGLASDSKAVAERFFEAYGRLPHYLSYGASIVEHAPAAVLDEYSLTSGGYLLVVCRLEPENNTDLVIRAFERVQTDKKLAIVGGVNYRSAYAQQLRRTRDPRVVFLGPVYKAGHLDALYYHSYSYVHGHEVGGTNPALLRAMGAGCCVLALDVPFNAEVLGGAGLLWEKTEAHLRQQIEHVLAHPEAVRHYGTRALRRVREAYDWERIVDVHEEYFLRLLDGGGRWGRPAAQGPGRG